MAGPSIQTVKHHLAFLRDALAPTPVLPPEELHRSEWVIDELDRLFTEQAHELEINGEARLKEATENEHLYEYAMALSGQLMDQEFGGAAGVVDSGVQGPAPLGADDWTDGVEGLVNRLRQFGADSGVVRLPKLALPNIGPGWTGEGLDDCRHETIGGNATFVRMAVTGQPNNLFFGIRPDVDFSARRGQTIQFSVYLGVVATNNIDRAVLLLRGFDSSGNLAFQAQDRVPLDVNGRISVQLIVADEAWSIQPGLLFKRGDVGWSWVDIVIASTKITVDGTEI